MAVPYASGAGVIASPPILAASGDTQSSPAELRVMADIIAQGRKSGELPPTQSSPLDAQAIVEDYALLSKLRLARGDPAVPPPAEYSSMRVEISQRIRDRDARLGDSECREAVTERVEGYLRAAGQEKRYHDLVSEVAKRRGVESQGADMERLMEEVMEAVEKGIGTTASDLGSTASELDSTASGLDSTAGVFDAVACSLGGTARTLNSAATGLNSTASSLESTLSVMATQISTLNSQILALTNALQSHHTAPTSPTSPTTPGPENYTPPAALEDSVRKGIEHAICEVLHGIQTSISHPPASPSSQNSSYSGSTLWERETLSDTSSYAGTKVKKQSRRASEDKTVRRAGKYVRILINKILG